MYWVRLPTAVLLALAAVSLPVYLFKLSPVVVEQAGKSTESVEERVHLLLAEAKVGPASLLAEAGDLEALAARSAEVIAAEPKLQVIGSPDPHLEAFLGITGAFDEILEGQSQVSVTALLASGESRDLLNRYLAQSPNTVVRRLLATRDMTLGARLSEATAPDGSPLEISLLASALLVQGDHFTPSLLATLKGHAEETLKGDSQSAEMLEGMYLSLLSLGVRLNWGQLTELVGLLETPEALHATAEGLRKADAARLPLFYSVALISGKPAETAAYVKRHEETGWESLYFALQAGRGALLLVLDQGRPVLISEGSGMRLSLPVSWMDRLGVATFAFQWPYVALGMKLGLLFLAAYLLVRTLARALASKRRYPSKGKGQPYALGRLRDGMLAALLFLAALMVFEPDLSYRVPQPEAPEPTLKLNVSSQLTSLPSDTMNLQALDGLTLLTLLLFFGVQSFIYILCLIKIRQIRRQALTADLKLKILENEEPLFDCGLYVGLGGTVLALILLALGIVQATLIAAYASTLFGILFVAVLKIVNVRPLRRALILERDATSYL